MKKFEPEVFVNAWGVQVLDMVESKRGEYVEAKEAEALEQLNKEMLEDFYSLLTYTQAHYPNNITLIDMIKTAIKKAEEV